MKKITILGATGSIGRSTLDVISRHPKRFRVVALTANRDVDRLEAQCLQFRPELAVLADPSAALTLKRRLAQKLPGTTIMGGAAALTTAAELPNADYVMAAIVGAAGLLPTLAAARAGKRLLLANKEVLVMAGQIFMDTIATYGSQLLPIDSEHNAIFQCLPPEHGHGLQQIGVTRIILTASGGPFRDTPLEKLHQVTPEQAYAHPTWRMGRKISIDSATMMNKGLELIEACWLFTAKPEQIQILIHPQSIIHSLVQYTDSTILAHLGNPDMRIPIAYALAWPERIVSGVTELDLTKVAALQFQQPDPQRYPCLKLAQQAMHSGGAAPIILNAANEIAVSAFIQRRIPITDIATVVAATLEENNNGEPTSIESVLQIDAQARATAQHIVRSKD